MAQCLWIIVFLDPLDINNSSYIQKRRCENYRGIALGTAAYRILANVILEKIKLFIETIAGFKILKKLINIVIHVYKRQEVLLE